MKFYLKTIFILSILTFCQCKKSSEKEHKPDKAPLEHEASHSSAPKIVEVEVKSANPPEPPQPKLEVIPTSPALQKELRDFVNRWNELPSQTTGKDLIAKQRELAYQAVGKLAGGAELTQFLQFLKNKGAADLHKELVEGALVS